MTSPSSGHVLTLNRGSATLKGALYATNPIELVLSIQVDRVDSPGARVKIASKSAAVLFDSGVESTSPNAFLDCVFDWLQAHAYLSNMAAFGHRLVHGGMKFRQPTRITADVLSQLQELIPIDPDHLPGAIDIIRFTSERFPQLPQIGCFDTSFHRTLPKVARMYALPHRLFDEGLMRFGFHGLSYEYIAGELKVLEAGLPERVIVAHLGSGASMAALRRGESIDTSMGFTPLEGLVMGARSGDVDPGALFYLLDQGKMTSASLYDCLNKQSGILGISESSGDMRDLLEKAPHDEHAAEAVALFCYRARKYVGAYAAALGGLDVLVFTGGIGEKSALVRSQICGHLEFLGIQLDAQRNQANAPLISTPASPVRVRVIETNEDLTIVRHVLEVIGRA